MAVRCWPAARSSAGGGTNMANWAMGPIRISHIPVVGDGDQHGHRAGRGLARTAVRCWPAVRSSAGGITTHGQLGDGSNTDSSIPVSVTGISTATAVTAGSVHSCALLAQRLGPSAGGTMDSVNWAMAPRPIPIRRSPSVGLAMPRQLRSVHISVVHYSPAARSSAGGITTMAQLGDGSNTDSNIPVSVTGISTAIAITAGLGHACAVLRSGSVKCWGFNTYGELGNGTTTNSNIPVRVREINAPTRLAAGHFHTCALFSGGVMRCWGQNDYGQLGNRRKTYIQPLARHRRRHAGCGVAKQQSLKGDDH